MAVNLASLLKRPVTQVKAPVTLESGLYYGVIKEYELGLSEKKKTPFLEYRGFFERAHEETDAGGIADSEIAGKKWSVSFWLNSDEGFYRLLQFLRSCGLEIPDSEEVSFDAYVPQVVSETVLVNVEKKLSDKEDENGQPRYFNDFRSIRGLKNVEDDGASSGGTSGEESSGEAAEGARSRRSRAA